ncbi:MAG TPA: hypothetical protein VGL51_06580 [Solirubrobacteraceae bacterium]|jgi:hypothetical protein
MQFDRDEYLLLSRGGRVPRARRKGPPPDPLLQPQPGVGRRPVKRRKSLLDSLLVAASMTRAAVTSVQEGLRDR